MSILPGQLWSVVVFRPERAPALMQIYNDLTGFLIMGLAVLGDWYMVKFVLLLQAINRQRREKKAD